MVIWSQVGKNNVDIFILKQPLCYKVSDTLTFASEQNSVTKKKKVYFSSIKVEGPSVSSPGNLLVPSNILNAVRHRLCRNWERHLLSQTKPRSQCTSLQRCSFDHTHFSWDTCNFLQMKQRYLISISIYALREHFKKLPSVWGKKIPHCSFYRITTALCLLVSTKSVERTKNSLIDLNM